MVEIIIEVINEICLLIVSRSFENFWRLFRILESKENSNCTFSMWFMLIFVYVSWFDTFAIVVVLLNCSAVLNYSICLGVQRIYRSLGTGSVSMPHHCRLKFPWTWHTFQCFVTSFVQKLKARPGPCSGHFCFLRGTRWICPLATPDDPAIRQAYQNSSLTWCCNRALRLECPSRTSAPGCARLHHRPRPRYSIEVTGSGLLQSHRSARRSQRLCSLAFLESSWSLA